MNLAVKEFCTPGGVGEGRGKGGGRERKVWRKDSVAAGRASDGTRRRMDSVPSKWSGRLIVHKAAPRLECS